MQIKNAVVVITGASSGIGLATARLFARHGATLVLAARAPEPVYSAERVAEAMLAVARRPRREVFVGGFGRLAALSHGLAPALTERVATAFTRWRLFQSRTTDATAGLIRDPFATANAGDADHSPLIWDRIERPLALAALSLPLALAWWSWRQRRGAPRRSS